MDNARIADVVRQQISQLFQIPMDSITNDARLSDLGMDRIELAGALARQFSQLCINLKEDKILTAIQNEINQIDTVGEIIDHIVSIISDDEE